MATTSLESRVGYRFHPTKEELVNHFLRKKILGHDDFKDDIPEIDICSCEPWDLPESDDDEWFYFSRPNYKPKGKIRNRATEKGFWKITGGEREIKARWSKALIGKKRTLTFYKGRGRSGQKTNWVMHEYYIPKTLLPNTATQRDFVLCHLKKKDESTDSGAGDEVEPRTNDASDIGNPLALVHGAGGPEENTQPEEFLGSLIPLRASTESPQSYVSFSSFPKGHFLLTNASSANHPETEDETEFANSLIVDPDDYLIEVRTHATLNHSTVGEKLLRVAQEKHSIEDQDMLSRALVTGQSSQNESGRRKGDMVISRGAQKQSGPDDYIPQPMVMAATAQSYRGQVRQGFKPQDVEYTSKVPAKPKPPKPEPEKPKEPERPCRNDEHKSMKQKQTGTTVGDWKSSFIVWKESPLSLRSYPPVVYAWNVIGGLILFIFMFGELVSYGNW